MTDAFHIALIAILGGGIPALLWLWFWLREDSEHPEPRQLIVLAFLAGVASVTIAVPIEQYIHPYLSDQTWLYTAWAYIEEFIKYAAALGTVLWRADDDEPVDAMMYMIIIALGFAAAENVLFLSSPVGGSTLYDLLITSNLRFMGATLLHVFSSSVIGAALGLAFYKSERVKICAGLIGVTIAGIVHALFNVHILQKTTGSVFTTFLLLWICIVVMFAIIEYIKRIAPKQSSSLTV